jgi:hypothetical protein
MDASTRAKLARELAVPSDAPKSDFIDAFRKLFDDEPDDGGSGDKTASRTTSDPRLAMAELVDERMRSKGLTFREAYNQVSRDSKNRALAERVERFYDPNLGLRGR